MKFNLCELDLIKNLQQKGKFKFYDSGFAQAVMDIGNIRKAQEDSLLISKHPVFDIEFLLVADGMGGLERGEYASHLAALSAFKWFRTLEKHELYNTALLKNKFEYFAKVTDEIIRKECGTGGTTLVGAFVLPDSILIVNIGDSRAYIYSDELIQVTKDHSITQNLLEEGVIEAKDDMRFHKKNNLILSRLGCEKKLLKIDYYELDVKNIEELFLFSDGITDCVSDDRLTEIIYRNREDSPCMDIVQEALSVDSTFLGLDKENYYDVITAGKDNASIVYKKIRRG